MPSITKSKLLINKIIHIKILSKINNAIIYYIQIYKNCYNHDLIIVFLNVTVYRKYVIVNAKIS